MQILSSKKFSRLVICFSGEVSNPVVLHVRLAESNKAILIHESVRDYLISKGFGSDVAFCDLKESAI